MSWSKKSQVWSHNTFFISPCSQPQTWFNSASWRERHQSPGRRIFGFGRNAPCKQCCSPFTVLCLSASACQFSWQNWGGRGKKKWRWSSGRWPTCWSDGSLRAARRGSRCCWVIVRISVSIQYQVNPALVSPTQILFSGSVMTVKFHRILKLVDYDPGETRDKGSWQVNIYFCMN